MRRFDINACFGHFPYWDLPHKTADDLVTLMDRTGIDRAACLSLRGIFADWRRGNEETLAAAAEHPHRLVPFATISPLLGGKGDELNRVLEAGARGIRLYPLLHNYRMDAEFLDDVCTVAAERQVPVMIPTRPMMNFRFQTLPAEAVGSLADRHLQTYFILSGPNHPAEYQALIQTTKPRPNIVCEISCLQGFNGIKNLVAEVGADRVLLGTGALLSNPACNVAKLDHAEIPAPQRKAIASENALRLLHLPP